MSKKYDVAAYIWPAYSGDEPRSHMFWNEGYGEWQNVKSAEKNPRTYMAEKTTVGIYQRSRSQIIPVLTFL